jgi:hypothetical protein
MLAAAPRVSSALPFVPEVPRSKIAPVEVMQIKYDEDRLPLPEGLSANAPERNNKPVLRATRDAKPQEWQRR